MSNFKMVMLIAFGFLISERKDEDLTKYDYYRMLEDAEQIAKSVVLSQLMKDD